MLDPGAIVRVCAAAVVGALAAAPHAAGSVWNEAGDAGQSGIGDAQVTVGAGALLEINGEVTNPQDADVYCIRIVDVGAFHASLVGGASFDTVLTLFDADGFGVVLNDDAALGVFQSELTNHGVGAPGVYYIAVHGYQNLPTDSADGLLFRFTDGTYNGLNDPIQWRPSPVAGALKSWSDGGDPLAFGAYALALAGVEFCEAPPPVCEGDADGNAMVDIDDITFIVLRLGTSDPDADVDGSGSVDIDDITFVVLRLGQCL